MLELRGVEAGYGRSRVLHGVSLRVRPGEVVSLLGRNGAGKSTTLKSILGLVRVSGGEIVFRGRSLAGMPVHRISRLGVGFVPEDRRIFTDLTVEENLEVGKHDGGPWTLERVLVLFSGLRDLRRRRAGNLSGGEQQMLALARTLVGNPALLLLDEPFEGLAPVVGRALFEAVKALKSEGIAILLAEQNVRWARRLADRACIIEKGQVKFHGSLAELESEPAVQRAYLSV